MYPQPSYFYTHLPAYEDETDSVPKRRHIKFKSRRITEKKAYNSRTVINLTAHGKGNLGHANRTRNCVTFGTNWLYKGFVNYCCDVLRPLFSVIFRDITILCSLYFNLFCRSVARVIIVISNAGI